MPPPAPSAPAPTDVDPYPTTFINIPWSDDYNPYQFEAWAALLDAPPQKSWGTQ